VVYSLFSIPPKNLGDPGSSRGTLERIRVGLTTFIETDARILEEFLLLKLYRAANGRLTKKDYGPIGEKKLTMRLFERILHLARRE
jgi:hypothetical protein